MNKFFRNLNLIFLFFMISVCGIASDIDEKDSVKKDVNETVENKIIVGEVEWVYLHEVGQSFKSRVDSGANTSSISASEIKPFKREGKNWVRFTVEHPDTNKSKIIEAPVVRSARINQASASNPQYRLVVSLEVSLGKKLNKKAQFTLADRSKMVYPILLGREFLQDITLIDVSKKFLHPKIKPEIK